MTAEQVGTANVPELPADLCAAIGYAPNTYLVSVPYGCNEIKIKALDDSLIMGETSDSQVLTEATPDADGYYTLTINITEEKLENERQWKDDGFSFFTNPEIPLFDIEEDKIPTEDVEGFFYYFLKQYSNAEMEFDEVLPDAVIIVQRSTAQGSGGGAVNKTALNAAIALVWNGTDYTDNYYKENDRYNGKTTDTITDKNSGFWAEFIAGTALNTAKSAASDANATGDQVTAATNALTAAIAKLIPIEQINATELYEQSKIEWGWFGNQIRDMAEYTAAEAISSDNTSPMSYAAYTMAKAAVEAELAKLFNADGTVTAYNSNTEGDAAANIQTALNNLEEAVAGLDKKTGGENAQIAYASLYRLANRIFNPSYLDENDYTGESWSAFLSARNTALAFYSNHSEPADVIGRKEAQSYVDAYCAFWNACYEGLIPAAAGTATLSVADVFALTAEEAPNEDALYGGSYTLAVPAEGLKLGDVLRDRYGDDYNNELIQGNLTCALGVYVNGVYLFNMEQNSADLATVGSEVCENVVIKPGDEILLARLRMPYSTNLSGGATVARAAELIEDIHYLSISGESMTDGVVAATAGEAVTLNASYALGMVNAYTGIKTAQTGATVYLSRCYASEAEARAVAAGRNTGIVTGTDGGFTLTLYAAEGSNQGWYALNLIASGERGGLSAGANILIHVTDPDDLNDLRAKLKEDLEAVYTAYDKEFYTKAQLTEINGYHDTALAAFDDMTATSGDLNAAYETAYQGITAIQTENETTLEQYLKMCKKLLAFLPNTEDALAGKIYNIDKMVLDLLFGADGWYTRMTPYQRNQFSSGEATLISALKEAYEESNNGANLPTIPAFTLKIEIRDTDTGETVALPLFDYLNYMFIDSISYDESLDQFNEAQRYEEGPSINTETMFYTLPTDAYYYMSIGTGPSVSEMGDYAYVGYDLNVDDHYIFDVDSAATYTLRENATKTIYVQLTDPEAIALRETKNTALAELDEAFGNYDRSKYSDENWTALRQEYQNGINAINNAESEADVQTALADAKSAMSDIPQKGQTVADAIPGWGADDDFDAGLKVGTVTVTVENTTFPGGAFPGNGQTGTIFSEPSYAIGENDNMMTVILRALYDEGFTWNGTVGDPGSQITSEDFDISYLSTIHKNGLTMGEFSGEQGSGWMGALNDFMVNEGLSQFSVTSGILGDGDVISVMFTQDYGADLGGTWGNNDTTLETLTVSSGTLVPGFASGEAGGNYDFALLIPSGSASVQVTPHAANINYMVKTFLNEKVTTNTVGNSFYRRTESISVMPGDVIYIGCGERAWPSMNKQGTESIGYQGTWYALHVISADDGADYVNELIAALPAANKINSGNYEATQAQIADIDAVIDVLSASEQAKVNTATLENVRTAVDGFEAISDFEAKLAALPSDMTKATKAELQAIKTAYNDLTDAQKALLTVAEKNKAERAIAALDGIIQEETDEEKLATAKTAIEAADFTVAQATANDAAALKTYAEGVVSALNLDTSITTEVTISDVTPAVEGTAEDTDGTDGKYTVSVALKLNSSSATATVTDAAITATAYVSPVPTITWQEALAGALGYVQSSVPNPGVGSTKGEWAVFALNRGGTATEDWNNKYLAALQSYVAQNDGVLHDKKYTEYSRVVIALTSLGYDATQFTAGGKTYDLVSPLLDKQSGGATWAEWQGNNGTCFALLARTARPSGRR